MSSKKFAAFMLSSIIGIVAFGFIVFRIPASDLASVVQFYFLYQGLISAGFFGFRWSEQWSAIKYSK